jgi:hypothetical protein
MNRYLRKQISILAVFLLIVFVIGAGVYFLTRKKSTASCTDGIQNQGETGIDCGAPCGNFCEEAREPIEILYQNFIPTIENNFDLVAEIKNPNSVWGAKAINYTFYLYDGSGENIASKQGSIYILPQETKYIVEPKIYSEAVPQRVELKIGNVLWQRLTGFRDMTLKIKEKNVQTGIGAPNRIYGVIENNTNYNLNKGELNGVVFDANNEIIAAGKTEMTTLMIGEDRYFEIGWPYVINGQVSNYDIKAYVNVFADNAFITVPGGLPKN